MIINKNQCCGSIPEESPIRGPDQLLSHMIVTYHYDGPLSGFLRYEAYSSVYFFTTVTLSRNTFIRVIALALVPENSWDRLISFFGHAPNRRQWIPPMLSRPSEEELDQIEAFLETITSKAGATSLLLAWDITSNSVLASRKVTGLPTISDLRLFTPWWPNGKSKADWFADLGMIPPIVNACNVTKDRAAGPHGNLKCTLVVEAGSSRGATRPQGLSVISMSFGLQTKSRSDLATGFLGDIKKSAIAFELFPPGGVLPLQRRFGMLTDEQILRCELLVRQSQRGDRSALTSLVQMWERPLFYYLRRFARSEADAWDLFQDVWLKVFRSIGSLRDARTSPAFLYRVARNTAISRLRVREFEDREIVGLEQDVELSVDEVAAFDNAEAVNHALDQLPLPQREALTLFFLQDLPLDEIAALLGKPLGTVKSRIHYAKAAIREILLKGDNHVSK